MEFINNFFYLPFFDDVGYSVSLLYWGVHLSKGDVTVRKVRAVVLLLRALAS